MVNAVRIKLELTFLVVPFNSRVLSCKPFIVITTFQTGWKYRDNEERPIEQNTTIEWDDGEEGNSN